ncbi:MULTISPECIES: type II 3-dehydroquinate dehydratase [unclassified Saccharicrinis]|uniref:type II 3-dehydroquinate dehydratase n=1 Tax=unclassified Saccharicrinis TaxID=2646859 RepID=UPI003D33A615
MKLLILNGPNLNLLGKREVSIYGNQTFESYYTELQKEFSHIELHYFQSNSEGSLVDKIQEVGFSYDGIVLNAGAYTHTSVAIADAISGISSPVIEVHISNIYKRESFRHHSYLSPVCVGTIAGFGLNSYKMAIHALINK